MNRLLTLTILFITTCLLYVFNTYKAHLSEYESTHLSFLKKLEYSSTNFIQKIKKQTQNLQKSLTPIKALENTDPTTLSIEDVFNETNIIRKKYGVSPLNLDPALSAAALERAKHMFRLGYFDHSAPSGASFDLPIKMSGYKAILSGENIALGGFSSDKKLVQAWYDSPGHKKNLLFPEFQEIGIATLFDKYKGRPTWIAVQLFSVPLKKCGDSLKESQNEIKKLREIVDQMLLELEKKKLQIANTVLEGYRLSELKKVFNKKYLRFEKLKSNLNNRVLNYNHSVSIYNTCSNSISKSFKVFKP